MTNKKKKWQAENGKVFFLLLEWFLPMNFVVKME